MGLNRITDRLFRATAALLSLVLVGVSTVAIAPAPVHAVKPDEILKDPKLEQRAREISLGLRCVVCQNQSIDDSDAPLARDLRLLVRERLKEGDSDKEVLDYVVARYGEFVLLRPPFGVHTIFLWLAPLLIFFGAAWLARRTVLASNQDAGVAASGGDAANALTPEEKERLERLLSDERTGRNDTPAS